ncbi:sialic acid-binding Ig-like lectin 8 isoform X1 [Heterodontus francisci]|uniref:sialic acid-binding Ig-like lectin 8 isoform X1 n=1 Tax=Heterodontus francisci TaxID=7792 RepID=UPI00355B76C2
MRSCVFASLMTLTQVICSAQCSVTIPKVLPAVLGSCAEIRCTFENPVYNNRLNGRWLKWGAGPGEHGGSIIYDSKDPHHQHSNYVGRAEFKGNLATNQCSLLIKNIKKSDRGTYQFILEMPWGWPIRKYRRELSPVSLSVSEKPRISGFAELIAARTARLTCSITDSCPNSNLNVKWIHYSAPLPLAWDTNDGAEIINNWSHSRRISSVLTFTPSFAQHGNILGCTIIIDGFQSSSSSTQTLTLQVKYKPTIVAGPICTWSENGTICSCQIRSNPLANITWDLNGKIITGNTSDVEVFSWAVNSYHMQSSLRLIHSAGTGNTISCAAANKHGDCISTSQLHSEGLISRTNICRIGGGACGLVILTAIVLMVKIQKKKRTDTACVSERDGDAVIYNTVQIVSNAGIHDQYTDAGSGAPRPRKTAQNKVSATINISDFHKNQRHMKNEETCEYAAISYK